MQLATDEARAEFSSKRRAVVTDSPKPSDAKFGVRRRERSGMGCDLQLPFHEPDQIRDRGSEDEKSNKKILEFDHREKMRHFDAEDRRIGHRSRFAVGEGE